MINNEDFSKRLQKVMEYYGENGSSFADKIGVQRSSISHILSGRNKPSLEFVLKVLNAFPEVDLYWLLNGKGSFPKKDTSTLPNPSTNMEAAKSIKSSEKVIERIIILYKDGSFQYYDS